MSTSLDARMVRTREALHNAILALLEEKPFEQITIREISKKAGIGYATFFRHHPSKESLLHDLAAGEISDLLERALPLLYANGSGTATAALCAYVDERHKLWSALLTGGAAGTVREEFVRQAKEIAAEAPDPGDWFPTELRVVCAVGAVVDSLSWWLRNREQFSAEKAAKFLDQLVISPTISKVPAD